MQIVCAECGDAWIMEEPLLNGDAEPVCPPCAEMKPYPSEVKVSDNKNYFLCEKCQKYFHVSDMKFKGCSICRKCFNNILYEIGRQWANENISQLNNPLELGEK